jgi:RHS repeat-associated protein
LASCHESASQPSGQTAAAPSAQSADVELRRSSLTSDVTVTLIDGWANPVADQWIDAIDADGATVGGGATNAEGQASISVDAGTYTFRASFGGAYFESDDCAVPGCTSATVQIMKPVQVTVTNGYGALVSDQIVLGIDDDGHQINAATTDGNGLASLYLPPGSYLLRALAGAMYFDAEPDTCEIPGCTSVSLAITDVLVSVKGADGSPAAGVRVAAVDANGVEINWVVTDELGRADVFVPAGAYKFRVTSNGNYFESGPDGHCVVTGCRTATISLSSCAGQPDGTLCDDGNACTQGDRCQGGGCVGGAPITCPAPDQCHTGGACDPLTGACSNPPKPDGSACDDGSACTRADACQAGVCVGNDPVVCPPPDACHAAGVCDAATGTCSNPPLPDGTCQLGAFDYDQAGRLIRDRGAELAYDAYDHLREVHPRALPPPPFANLPVESLGNISQDISFAEDVNAAGAIVGEARDGKGIYHAFLSAAPGPFIDLRAAAGVDGSMFGSGISDAGTVVGTFTVGSHMHAYRYSAAHGLEDLGVLGSTSDFPAAMDINVAGQIAGYTKVGRTEYHGFRYTDGVGFQPIGTLGGASSEAFYIDEIGAVYGTAQTSTSPPIGGTFAPEQFGHAVIFDDIVGLKDVNDLIDPTSGVTLVFPGRPAGDWLPMEGTVGTDQTLRAFRVRLSTGAVDPIDAWPGEMRATAVNSFGDVVGWGSKVAGSTSDADQAAWFFNDQFGFIDLNTVIDPASGWSLKYTGAINDTGDVVGYGIFQAQLTAFRLRLPLRANNGGPTVAEAHTYGYDGLRTTTTTSPGTPSAKVQAWFTQDYTEHDRTRDHYLRVGNRIVGRVTMTSTNPAGQGASPLAAATLDRAATPASDNDRSIPWWPLLALVGLLMGGRAFARGPPRMAWRRAAATLTGVTLLMGQLTCSSFNQRTSAESSWQVASDRTLFFHEAVSAGPALITNTSGESWEERRYEPFGAPVDAFSASAGVHSVSFASEPQNSLGKLTDPNTGWSYHGARWMQPQTARWLVPDPAIKGPDPRHAVSAADLNPYAYVTNNPTLYWDPEGQQRSWRDDAPLWVKVVAYLTGAAFVADATQHQANELQQHPNDNWVRAKAIAGAPVVALKHAKSVADGVSTAARVVEATRVVLHFRKFEGGASFLVPKSTFDKHLAGQLRWGRDDGVFVAPKGEMDAMLKEANGDRRVIKQRLAIKEDQWNEPLVRVDVDQPLRYHPRLPTGGEAGANSFYTPGGKTAGGVSELVIDPPPSSEARAYDIPTH